jgi:ADP-ribosylglycohydrolase
LLAVRDSSISVAESAVRFATTGYVVDSVPFVILAAIRSSDVLVTIRQIVQCGGDTDTIASMFGQIFGAAFGTGALPMEVVNRIDAVTLVRATAANFSLLSIAK